MGNHIAHNVVLLKRRSDFRGGTTLRLERSPGYAPARQGHARSKAAQACCYSLPRFHSCVSDAVTYMEIALDRLRFGLHRHAGGCGQRRGEGGWPGM